MIDLHVAQAVKRYEEIAKFLEEAGHLVNVCFHLYQESKDS